MEQYNDDFWSDPRVIQALKNLQYGNKGTDNT